MFKIFLSSSFLLISAVIFAQVKLPRIIRDSMVLQHDSKINIWGWASAGEKVTVQFNNKTYKTTTNTTGKWTMQLAPAKAGGPYRMEIDRKSVV